MKYYLYLSFIFLLTYSIVFSQQKINRKEVVQRHKVFVKKPDTLSSLTVGNGEFAFTTDVTGLQTFPKEYQHGVPLGTQSEWGWHSFPNTENFKFEETLRYYELNGKKIPYSVQIKEPKRGRDAVEYFRKNTHRLQLANIGFEIIKKDGSLITLQDLQECDQQLDPWTGEINSTFNIEGETVKVTTYAHQEKDVISAKITSRLLTEGKIKINIKFPFPTAQFSDMGVNYAEPEKHSSKIAATKKNLSTLKHTLDTTTYYLHVLHSKATLSEKAKHHFIITPELNQNTFEFTVLFSRKMNSQNMDDFNSVKQNSESGWEKFWLSGAAIDFAGSTDKRALELERRVILSQYLTKAQCAGHLPPQETGLTYNSWYGKPHLEMYWWHAAHFALWNRTELLEKSLDWYFTVYKGALEIAKRQGYKGARWQKMTDYAGNESPSSIGALLVWQQPHIIYLAELIYKNKKDTKVLEKYKELIFATADFMASFPTYDSEKKKYNLGKGLIPAQECFNAVDTYNPTYELAYWNWALNTAQEWRTRLKLEKSKEWDQVLNNLAPLPQNHGVYLAAESVPDCYAADSKYLIDHPAVLGALGSIPPSNGLDTAVMHRTYNWVDKVWTWNHTWGWDFPLVAMTATRLHSPQQAIDALFKDVTKNTYLPNGHNYQDERLTIYLPGNGGILSAVALMCAGYEGCPIENPGFPKDGSWKVKWENLNKMP